MNLRKIRDCVAVLLSAIRVQYLRLMGVEIGRRCFISRKAIIDVARGQVVIGNNVSVTSGSYILSHTRGRKNRDGQKTVLEDHVLINVNAIVLPGIKIGRNSMVGAGSVVTQDVPADVVVLGNPARVIARNRKRGYSPSVQKGTKEQNRHGDGTSTHVSG